MNELPFDSLHEECGVFGVFGVDDAPGIVYYGLHALQHRGQEACGIVSAEEGRLASVKGEGLVTEVFNGDNLSTLHGRMAIGHVRYSTAGGGGRENVQPFVFRHHTGDFALAHNGNLVNSRELVRYLEDKGSLFHSTSDSEILAHLIKKEHSSEHRIFAIIDALNMLEGGFAFLIMTENRLYACRDKYGLRPLSIGRLNDGWVVSSETCALDIVGAEFVRDVNPGEIVTLDRNGIRSRDYSMYKRNCMCAMEYIYFARPDSDIECCNVHAFRKESGRLLFEEAPADADVVIGVPDSSLSAAIGYSEASGIPYEMGLVKNRYIGRTFIQPSQAMREKGAHRRLDRARYDFAAHRAAAQGRRREGGARAHRIAQDDPSLLLRRRHLDLRPVDRPPLFGRGDMPPDRGRLAGLPLGGSAAEGRQPQGDVHGLLHGPLSDGALRTCRRDRPQGGQEPLAGYSSRDKCQTKNRKNDMAESYEKAGVNLEAGYEVVRRIKKHVASTARTGVMGTIGAFGGMFDLAALGVKEPVLVSGTDGVGTKLKLAFALDKHDTIGIDAVAMCVNDVLAQGAEPLFFLDYVAVGHNEPVKIEGIVCGVAEGCRQAGCALVGGETAEMPGMYEGGEYDIAGFTVGVVERSRLIDGSKVKTGDVLVGIASSGVHSNGFSLVRKVLSDNGLELNKVYPELSNRTLGEVLLTPTKIYVKPVLDVIRRCDVHGISHITGGGFDENIPRILHEGQGIAIEEGTWEILPVFRFLEKYGKIAHREMFNIFNMGVGMVIALDAEEAQKAVDILASHGEQASVIGRVTDSEGVVIR